MTGFARKELVEAPTRTPARFGLLTVADVVTEDDPHWMNGVKFLPDSCAPGQSYADTCPAVADRTKSVDRGVAMPGADPFTVYAGFYCSPTGFTQAEILARAEAALAGGEGRTIEAVLVTGDTDNGEVVHPFLENTADVDDAGFDVPVLDVLTSVEDVPHAIGALEGALRECYPGVGTILVPAKWSPFLETAGVVRNGPMLETLLGTKVGILSVDTDVLYGVGQIQVHRSAPNVLGPFGQALNKVNNSVLMLAERTYTIAWDCCLVGVTINEAGGG